MCSLLYAKCFLLLTRQSILNGYPPFKWYYIFNALYWVFNRLASRLYKWLFKFPQKFVMCSGKTATVQFIFCLDCPHSADKVKSLCTILYKVKSLCTIFIQVQMWVNTRDGWGDVTIIDNYWYYWFPYGINVIPSRFIQLSAMYGMGTLLEIPILLQKE